jgi:RluA family pseudouridine synthase
MEDRIVFEDDYILVVNKPHGMPTQGSEKKKSADLYSELQNYLETREGQPVYLALHHRLDAATAGLILFAKDKSVNKEITDLFREKTIEKTYECLVDIEAPIELEEWTVKNKLTEYRFKHFKKAKSSSKGKSAQTKFVLLEQTTNCARIQCKPLTGRLHQIRVHLSEDKMPVQGDFHYNEKFRKISKQQPTTLKLCATQLSFAHPKTKEKVSFKIKPEF